MIRILSDALTSANDRQVTLIGLLDLSLAFDYVDQQLLLRRLHDNFGFTDDVLHWTTSFVSGWTQQVLYNGQISPIHPPQFRVPQGSVVGPPFFVLYTADLKEVTASHHLRLHPYADDCPVCVTTSVDDTACAGCGSPGRMCC